jgi:Uma2 family endonuclease
MTALTAPIRKSGGRRFVLHGVSWDEYEAMLTALENRHVFVSYYKGTLELMSPHYPHDRSSRLLLFFVAALAEAFNIPLHSVGTTTFRRKQFKVGLEADEAFYTFNSKKIRARKISKKESINLEIDPPPDLAIEVEISRRLGARSKIYACLGVPEVWKFNGVRLTFNVLQKDGTYKIVEKSPTFPKVTTDEIAGWLQSGIFRDDMEWLKDVRAWLKERAENHP